jgi:hypothetical protein
MKDSGSSQKTNSFLSFSFSVVLFLSASFFYRTPLFASSMLILMQRSATLSHRLPATLPLSVKVLQLPDTYVSSNRDVVPKIPITLDVIKVGCDALIDLPCTATTLKGCCKRPDCKSFIRTYTSLDEWNAHLALHKMTPRNLVLINDSAKQLRTTMAKKYFAKMADNLCFKLICLSN